MAFMRRLERKLRFLRIPNLMNYIVLGMACVWVLNMMNPAAYSLFSFSRELIFRGQVWRLVSFVFLPPSSSILWLVISLYFYWMIGSALENQWGASRFTLYYLVGMLGSVAGGMITGAAVNTYLNLSLFFAFAATWPDYEVLLFFILPVKMKILALLNACLYLWQLAVGGWPTRLAIVFSLLNVLLFLGGDLFTRIREDSRYWKTRWNFRRNTRR